MRASLTLRVAILGAAGLAGCNAILGLEVGELIGTGGTGGTAHDAGPGGQGGGTGTGAGGAGTGGHGGATASGGSGGHGGAGTGGLGGSGGAGGAPTCDPACAAPKVPDCETVSCVGGTCESKFAAAFVQLASQTPGDCKVWVCDGKGGMSQQVDNTDADDANDCTDDACDAGSATHSPSVAEQPCWENGGKFCDGKGACVACVTTPDCADANKVCDGNVCVAQSCKDAQKNDKETDVDCGGPACAPCVDGKACLTDTDCMSQLCDAGMHCAAPGCGDGVKNGDETDVDCGGSCAGKCGPNKGCAKPGDCVGGECNGSTCVPNCVDKVMNGTETALDCGGGACPKCAEGLGCKAKTDCASGGCCNAPSGTCSACCDGAKNGSETGVDCGGSCAQKCADGFGCAVNGDCLSKLCQGSVCQAGTCSNGVKNGDETDVDCGGSCSPCTQSKLCSKAGDCANGLCIDGVCCDTACGGVCTMCNLGGAVGTCTNIAASGTDNSPVCAGVNACDGAGACKKVTGQTCAALGECVSGFCADSVCCNSACGASCNACSAALTGGANGTCGNVTNGTDPKNACAGADVCVTGGKCQCSDGMKDGAETDVDCGGGVCAKCGAGKLCSGAADCASGTCSGAPLKCVGGLVEGPSCAGGLTCPGGLSCCDAPVIPGGTFPMGRSVGGTDACPGGMSCWAYEQPEHNATVADFRLDRFEVTVGRFRKFVTQFNGTPPAVNVGAHPLIANSGWQAGWNGSLAASQAALISNLKCNATYQTWTDGAVANESYAINCVSWYEAFAFCAWDGGRLPTEAEWEYAAAGGSDNKLYPWGSTDPSLTKTLANYSYSDNSPFIAVGSHPTGNGKWGHRDLAGGMWEWNLDWWDVSWYSGAGQSCSNCANLNQSPNRVIHGGGWGDGSASTLRSACLGGSPPSDRVYYLGLRCARD